MSRLINTGSAGKDRQLLEKGITLAIRKLAEQNDLDSTTLDLLAYISLSLVAISETIETSVAAWEKRGYWVKADRYRMEWTWADHWGKSMKQAIVDEDWATVAKITAQVTEKLSTVKVAQQNRLGTPWIGSYKKLVSPDQSH
ncbi:MAG: hypothetical protein C3F13_15065 [Anaerolineales bacterium]|nr:MAG: hypothetical protein C3F13_15065 [Anaerolineales bacterium]